MRLSREQWLMGVAKLTAQRTTCLRRAVGAVLVDVKGRVLATGYNGVARGMPHCNEVVTIVDATDGPKALNGDWGSALGGLAHPHACPAATAASGTQLDGCKAIHAEQNALLQCANVDAIEACFVTCSPCLTCVKLLLNTPCFYIYFAEPYAHDAPSRELWESVGRRWTHLA